MLGRVHFAENKSLLSLVGHPYFHLKTKKIFIQKLQRGIFVQNVVTELFAKREQFLFILKLSGDPDKILDRRLIHLQSLKSSSSLSNEIDYKSSYSPAKIIYLFRCFEKAGLLKYNKRDILQAIEELKNLRMKRADFKSKSKSVSKDPDRLYPLLKSQYNNFANEVWKKRGKPVFGKRTVERCIWGNPRAYDYSGASTHIGLKINTNKEKKKYLEFYLTYKMPADRSFRVISALAYDNFMNERKKRMKEKRLAKNEKEKFNEERTIDDNSSLL
jgi:hypothetical protein